MKEIYYVYILTNMKYGVLYVGITNDLVKRIQEHKYKMRDGFSKQYNTNKLVYYEIIEGAEAAMKREKTLKRWPREWKINVIEKFNYEWKDLYNEIAGERV